MNKKIIYLIIVILLSSFISSESVFNSISMGYYLSDACRQGGNCTLTNLVVTNQTTLANVTVTNYNITGDMDIYGNATFYGELCDSTGLCYSLAIMNETPDISGYWLSDGSSTATGDWDIGEHNLTAKELSADKFFSSASLDHSGNYATALGSGTNASGTGAFASGSTLDRLITASGRGATALGYAHGRRGGFGYITASGAGSVAMGEAYGNEDIVSIIASGDGAVAIGAGARAISNGSFAVGNAYAGGKGAVAMGEGNTANGVGAFCAGQGNSVGGNEATALGGNNIVSGYIGFAAGSGLNSSSFISSVFGRYNIGGGSPTSWVATDPLFEIGMGTATNAKANALTVYKNGNTEINGNLNVTGNTKILGNVSFENPHLYGFDNSTQQFQTIETAQVMNLSNTDYHSHQINIIDNQNITFDRVGHYQICVSPQFYQSSGNDKWITFWLQENGVDVEWSNTRYTMDNDEYEAPRICWETIITTPATDNVRIMWLSDSTSSYIQSITGLTSPVRPSVPGVIMDVHWISNGN